MGLWHQRLGHVSTKTIDRMNTMAVGLEKLSGRLEGICHGCELGKGHRDPFPTSTTQTTEPLELVHCDLAGPMKTPTLEGSRTAVVFINDYTHMHFISTIDKKSDAFQVLHQLVATLERQSKFKTKRFRTDNDSVFTTSHAANASYRQHGIIHETTVPYSPSQNGVAKRAIRLTVESANARLQTAEDLPSKFTE